MEDSHHCRKFYWQPQNISSSMLLASSFSHAENAFNEIQHPFMIKPLSKVGMDGKFFNLIKQNKNWTEVAADLIVKASL